MPAGCLSLTLLRRPAMSQDLVILGETPSSAAQLPHNEGAIKWKLFIMMILELFIWGAWLPVTFAYLGQIGFSGTQQFWIGSSFAIASIIGIFFSNQWADRNFSAERFLAVSHLIGGLAIGGLYFTRDFWVFLILMMIHSICYVPTISVANSLAFSNLRNPTRDFGLIRMGGTVGWILAAWPLYFILSGREGEELVTGRSTVYLVSAAASLLLAAYSLLLPHTPPRRDGNVEPFAWMKALRFLKVPAIGILFAVTLIDATIHNGYFLVTDGFLTSEKVGVEDQWVMPVMSIGQVAEILTMAILGYVLKSLGWRTTMIIGILGHALRFGIFAFFPDQKLIIAVQVLHGICYAFFFATVYIFIDAAFPKDIRASAQGLFNLLILGLGDLCAKGLFLLLLMEWYSTEDGVDYFRLFLWPTGLALVASILLAVAFWPDKSLDVRNVDLSAS